jgi:hypothetical protein
MRRSLRLLHAFAARRLASAPSQVALEVAVAAAFVVPLYAISLHEAHPRAEASSMRVVPAPLPARAVLPALPCRPHWNDAHPLHPATGPGGTLAGRCGDLASYV